MEYKIEDLDYIFIRALNKQDMWDSVSLKEVSDGEFIDWVEKRFWISIKNKNKGKPWTSQQKVDLLNDITKGLGYPAVIMINREAREILKKGTKYD